MNILAKSFFLAVGVIAGAIALKGESVPAAIVSAGTFIAYAIMESAEFRPKK